MPFLTLMIALESLSCRRHRPSFCRGAIRRRHTPVRRLPSRERATRADPSGGSLPEGIRPEERTAEVRVRFHPEDKPEELSPQVRFPAAPFPEVRSPEAPFPEVRFPEAQSPAAEEEQE